MRKDNRGLSLVELIISIAILVIVGGAITQFMNVGVVSFAKTNSEVDLQSEAQLCMSQVMDIAIDTNYAIEKSINGDGNTLLDLYSYTSTYDDVTHATDHTYFLDRILYEASEQKLWYYRYDNIGNPTAENKETQVFSFNTLPAPTGGGELLAERITAFNVWVDTDPSKSGKFAVNGKNVFNISVKFERDDREYEGFNNVTLRNKVFVDKTLISSGGGTPPTPTGTVDRVEVTPSVAIGKRGGSVAFHAAVRGTGGLSQDVTWRLTGNTSSSTTINNGVVSIAVDETSPTMEIYAKSVQDPTKESDPATLNIKEITAVNVSFETTTFRQNDTVVAKATVVGYNLNADEDQKVKWKVLTGGSYIAQNGNNFRIALGAPVGTEVTLVATSVVDPTVSSTPVTFTVEPYDNTSDSDDSGILKVTSPVVIKRDGSGTFTATVDSANAANNHLEWAVSLINQADGKEYKSGSVYSYRVEDNKCIVNVYKSLDFDDSAFVYANCYLVPNGKSIESMSADDKKQIPKREGKSAVDEVGIVFGVDSVAEGLTDIKPDRPIYYTQPYKTTYKYELKGIENTGVDWKGYNTDWLKISMSSEAGTVRLASKSIEADSEGVKTVAEAYIGKKKLGNTIEVAVAPANIPAVPSLASGKKPFVVYLPLPKEKKFPYRTTEEIKSVTRDSFKDWDFPGHYNFPDYQNFNANFVYYPRCSRDNDQPMWYVYFTENGVINYSVGYYKISPNGEQWLGAWAPVPNN